MGRRSGIDLETFDKYKRLFQITCKLSDFPKKELKRRYRRLALKYHPDKGGQAEHFRFVKEAYDYLLPFCSEKNIIPNDFWNTDWNNALKCWYTDFAKRMKTFQMYRGNNLYNRKPY